MNTMLSSPDRKKPTNVSAEKRVAKRYGSLIPFTVFRKGTSFRGICRNLGEAGMALRFERNAPPTAKYTVVLALGPKEPIPFEVVEKYRYPVEMGDERYWDIGVEVVDPDSSFTDIFDRAEKKNLGEQFYPMSTDLALDFEHRQRLHDEYGPTNVDLANLPVYEEAKKRVGPFELSEKLGNGTIGSSFRARDDSNRMIVLKVIHASNFQQPQDFAAWQRYLEKLQTMGDDYLVPILDVGTLHNGSHLYYTTPYYPARSLAHQAEKLVKRGAVLHHSYVTRWMEQILQGLLSLHLRNMTHLNLKPSNVLVNDQGDALLCDPMPPSSMLSAQMRTSLQTSTRAQFTSPAILEALQSRVKVPRHWAYDCHGFGGLYEYLLTGRVKGMRSAVLERPFSDEKRQKALIDFLGFCREATPTQEFKHDWLAFEFYRHLPEDQGWRARADQALLGSPATLYRNAAGVLAKAGSANANQRLSRLASGLDLSEKEARELGESAGLSRMEAAGTPGGPQAREKTGAGKELEWLDLRTKDTGPFGQHWLVDALVYPFRSWMSFCFLALAIPVLLAPFLLSGPSALAGGVRSLRFRGLGFMGLVGIAALGFVCAIAKAIINNSANGEKEFFEWPSLMELYDDFVLPFIQVTVTVLVCLGPAILYGLLGVSVGYFRFGEGSGFEFTMPMIVEIGLCLMGLAYLPFALMNVAVHDSVFSMDPRPFFQVLPRLFSGYVVMVSIFGCLSVVGLGVASALLRDLNPYVGFPLAWAICFYLIFVHLRSIGLFYYRNEDLFWHYT
ncbi:Protein kinase [Sulfidibacter corallicola]|uniref:non-specific serine/threonine protein kinase n=1 Tax=Sulfidibacter corallicola TaxID=2818388 RepID=A0A8A4TML1_SULCO|nr:protein kinase [Sulfidibacter corallicola]QTD50342.1 protein kinase [Sulfidibacter corallicola]